MREGVLQRVKDLAQEVATREGCILYDVELSGSAKEPVLRVYIDRADNSGVTIDHCADVSQGLNLLLDMEDDLFNTAYSLEVSSPGIERKLTEFWHFEKAVGETIRVQTQSPMPPPAGAKGEKGTRKTLEGQMIQINEDNIVVNKDGCDWEVPRSIVEKANVVFPQEKPGPQKKQKGKNKR